MIGRARRRYPGNGVPTRTVVYGPNPVSVATQGGLDVAYGRGLAGGMGVVNIGLQSMTLGRWNGDLGPLQAFRDMARIGATQPVRSEDRGLPNTAPPGGSRMALLIGAAGVNRP